MKQVTSAHVKDHVGGRTSVRASEGLANVRYEIRGKLARRALDLERLGYDIGFERALLDWIRKHREGWRATRRQSLGLSPQPKQ